VYFRQGRNGLPQPNAYSGHRSTAKNSRPGRDHFDDLVSGPVGIGCVTASHPAFLKAFNDLSGHFLVPIHLVLIHGLPPFMTILILRVVWV
jgi:hypothetical protein